MTDQRHLLRLELAACALASTVLLTMVVVAVDALRFDRAMLTDVTSPIVLLLAVELLASTNAITPAGALVYLLRPVSAELCLPLSTALGAPLAISLLGLACVPAGMVERTAARVVGSG